LLGAVVTSETNEAAQVLDSSFDPQAWVEVLTEILRLPQRPAAGGACEIHDIATLRLIRDAKHGAFVGASFADDDPEDAA
jgi:hypothetical protein